MAGEEQRAVGAALEGLGHIDRQALILASQGYRGAEIAHSIGRSDVATRTLICRARAKVRARMLASRRQAGPRIRPRDAASTTDASTRRPSLSSGGAVVDQWSDLERETLIGRGAERGAP